MIHVNAPRPTTAVLIALLLGLALAILGIVAVRDPDVDTTDALVSLVATACMTLALLLPIQVTSGKKYYFDTAVMIAAVLLHNPKPVTRAVLREAHRVLRAGGRIIVLNDLPNSRTPATLPNQLYVLALKVSGRGDRNGPVRTYSRAEVDALFAAFADVEVRPTGRAVLPKRIPGAPASVSRRYRAYVHDPVQRWAEQRLPASWLDRLYFNVCVSATR